MDETDSALVWYGAYGSNLSAARFGCYLGGGRPPGATRVYPGCRDRTPARDDRPFTIGGGVHFAWESPTWGGGIAFYDPHGPGPALMRAWLVNTDQFADIASQEMHRPPGGDLDLAELYGARTLVLGPGRYESLHVIGELDGRPVITFTHSEPLRPNRPAPAYLQTMAVGLQESHGLSAAGIVDYLASCAGIGVSPDQLTTLLGGRRSAR